MNAQHTPAPWNDGLHHQGHLAIQSDNGRLVALCGAMARNDEQLENLANARLIAAAPDLLAVLQEAVRVLDYAADALDAPEASHFRATIADARAAIAKATGENT